MKRNGPQQRAPDYLAGFLHAAPFAVIATGAASFLRPRPDTRVKYPKDWSPPHQERTMTTKRFTEEQIIGVARAYLRLKAISQRTT